MEVQSVSELIERDAAIAVLGRRSTTVFGDLDKAVLLLAASLDIAALPSRIVRDESYNDEDTVCKTCASEPICAYATGGIMACWTHIPISRLEGYAELERAARELREAQRVEKAISARADMEVYMAAVHRRWKAEDAVDAALDAVRQSGRKVSDNAACDAQVGDNPDTQAAGDADKPRTWRCYGDANIRLDPEWVEMFTAAMTATTTNAKVNPNCPHGYATCPGCGNYDDGECEAKR